MVILQTILASLLSVVTMFLITKLIGCRQVSQMSLFDYINGITIGSIGAELAIAAPKDIPVPMTAILVYGGVSVLLAVFTNKSRRAAGVINGRPLILLQNGKLYKKNFTKARLDLDEFVMHCRTGGYFDLSQIECAVLEANGKLSLLPKASDRPTTPADFQITVEQAEMPSMVILDGKVDACRLQAAGMERVWLEKQLKNLGFSAPKEVFLAFISGGVLHAFPYGEDEDIK